MLITIDDYYDIRFYNETREALKNNGVDFKEYINAKPPYRYYIDSDEKPSFINFDVATNSQSRWMVNIVRAVTPTSDYIYERRDSFKNTKAIQHYAINDALLAGQKSGEGIFFTAEKDEILRISKEYPRKIYYLGRYFNRRYKVFFTDNLIIKNELNPDQILVESNSFKSITELEVDLNFKIFKMQDRLEKLSESPFVLKGTYYPLRSVRPEVSDMYVLS